MMLTSVILAVNK